MQINQRINQMQEIVPAVYCIFIQRMASLKCDQNQETHYATAKKRRRKKFKR